MPKKQNRAVERENGCVALDFNNPRLSAAMLWKIPRSLIKDYSKKSNDIWLPVLEEMKAWLKRMKAITKNANDPEKLAKNIGQGFEDYGVLFSKRMSDFIPNAVTYFKFDYLLRKAVGKKILMSLKKVFLEHCPSQRHFRIRQW